jgi:hypothetical protein
MAILIFRLDRYSPLVSFTTAIYLEFDLGPRKLDKISRLFDGKLKVLASSTLQRKLPATKVFQKK